MKFMFMRHHIVSNQFFVVRSPLSAGRLIPQRFVFGAGEVDASMRRRCGAEDGLLRSRPAQRGTRLRSGQESALLGEAAFEGVLEAEVEEDAPLGAARGGDFDGQADAGNDLEAAREVVGPADAGVEDDGLLATDEAGGNDGGFIEIERLEEEIREGVDEPDEALAEIDAAGAGAVADFVFRVRDDGSAGVKMERESFCGEDADGQVELNAGCADAASEARTA